MTLLYLLDIASVAVFGLTGALVASRSQLDIVGFIFIACLTAVGGGTIRDVLLNRDAVFWVADPSILLGAVLAAVAVFFTAHRLESRYRAILWLDACRDPEVCRQEVRMKEGLLGPNMPCVESLCQQRATESSRSSWLRGIQIYLYRPRWLLLMAPRVRLGSRLCVCARHLRGMCGRTESESGRNNVQLATNPATCRCT